MGEIKVAKNFVGSHSGRDTERPSPVAGSLSAFMLEKGSTGRGSKGYGQAYAAWYRRRRQDKARGTVTPTNASKTPSMSTPRGYQYDPSTYKSAVPKVSTTSGPNVGYKNPRDMAGKTNFKGTTGDKIKIGAAIVGGFAAVPATVIAAPIVAGAVGAFAAAPGAGALGAGLASGAGLAAKFVRGAGGVVSKTATATRSAVSPGYRATTVAAEEAAKKAAASAVRAAAKKAAAKAAAKKAAAKKAADDAAQKGVTAAAQNTAGALAQQNARLGGGPRGGSR